MNAIRLSLAAAAAVTLIGSGVMAQDWEQVARRTHAELQAVNEDGSPAYTGGFPARVIGVVLNNSEDWLDPTPNYDAGVTLWYMGGQAEIFIQALDKSTLPTLGIEYYNADDFGGTAAWMGQNYGNHMMHQDPMFSYSDAAWTAELGRLNLFGGDEVTDPIRAGDLVEIQARAGLHYQGKMNINEQHSTDPAKDFEIVRLASGFGLPDAAVLTLGLLKDEDNHFLFDPQRQSGGEHYQSTRVVLKDVHLVSADWTAMGYLTVADGDGRDLQVRLGYGNGTDWSGFGAYWEAAIGDGVFDIVGILNQTGGTTGGYYLVALTSDAFIPEPASLGVMAMAALALLRRKWQRRREPFVG